MQSYPLNTHGYAGVYKWVDGAGHPFWHTVYIGLGVVPNRYGIAYNDSDAVAYVRSVDAAAPYVGSEYESILRNRVLHLITHDPGFVLRAEKRKVGEVLAAGLDRFWPLLMMLPFAIAVGIGRGRRRRYASVLLPVAVIAILPPLIAVPTFDYEQPWLGLLATTGVLCGCWLMRYAGAWVAAPNGVLRRHPSAGALLETGARWDRRRVAIGGAIARRFHAAMEPVTRASKRLRWAARRTASAVAAFGPLLSDIGIRRWLMTVVRSRAFYVVVAVVAAGFTARAYLQNWQAKVAAVSAQRHPESPTLPFDAVLGSPLHEWRLARLPVGWTTEPGTHVLRGTVLTVLTTTANNAYQLASPVLSLPPGRYTAAIRGQLRSGGLALGVLDVAADKWLRVTIYQGGTQPSRVTMINDFTISTAKQVRIILSNKSISGLPSEWLLTQALITSQTAGTGAAPVPSPLTLPATGTANSGIQPDK